METAKEEEVSRLESNVHFRMIDMPYLHNLSGKNAMQLMRELGNTPNFKFFDSEVVQTLISYLYKPILLYTILFLVIPYCVLFGLYMYFSHYLVKEYIDLKYEEDALEEGVVNEVLAGKIEDSFAAIVRFCIVMIVFAVYFIYIEGFQIKKQGFVYFSNFWSYIDFMPSVMIIVTSLVFFLGVHDPYMIAHLMSVCTLFYWCKFLSILRMFKSFSYLIRMIVLVVFDMKYFLGVLLLAMTAFGDGFYMVSNFTQASDEEEGGPFIESFVMSILYVYNMSLGEYDNSYGIAPTFGWVLFTFSTLFNMIVMLNLLIAIISDTFAKV